MSCMAEKRPVGCRGVGTAESARSWGRRGPGPGNLRAGSDRNPVDPGWDQTRAEGLSRWQGAAELRMQVGGVDTWWDLCILRVEPHPPGFADRSIQE